MEYNRSFYCKKLAKAAKLSNKGKKTNKNEINFHDNLDWDVVKNQGVWTDVYFQCGHSSIFAFTVSSSFASSGYMKGSMPEAIRDFESGLWDLYIHKKYISHDDVGRACEKWIKLQAPIKEIRMGCNFNFNGTRYGYVFTRKQYPMENQFYSDDYVSEEYRVASYCNPIKIKGGVCG